MDLAFQMPGERDQMGNSLLNGATAASGQFPRVVTEAGKLLLPLKTIRDIAQKTR